MTIANVRLDVRDVTRRGRRARHAFSDTVRQIATSPYLRLMAALVFLAAVTTQWTAFQLSLAADLHFNRDADALTAFYGTFNFTLGAVSFLLQLLLVGPALRRFGLALTILILPMALGTGNALILLAPAFWSVLMANALDQGFRFSLDKTSYELLYLPLAPSQRAQIKTALDVVVSRLADAVGAVLLGVATQGFFMLDGLGLGLRGTAAVNLAFVAAWVAVAIRCEPSTCARSRRDHRHRIDSEEIEAGALDRTAASVLAAKLESPNAPDVIYALDLLETQDMSNLERPLRWLLGHELPDIRCRALAMLSAARDTSISRVATDMLRDPDLGVRTEALLYVTREMRVDPLPQLEELGEFEEFSIRAGMAAFLASPGPSQNLDAARVCDHEVCRRERPA